MHKITIKYAPHPKENPKEQICTNSHKSGDVYIDGKYEGEIYFDKDRMTNDGSFFYELNFCHRDAACEIPNFLKNVSHTLYDNITESGIRAGVEVIAKELVQRYEAQYKSQFTLEVVDID